MSTIADVRFAHEEGALAHTFTELPEADAAVIRETSTEPLHYFIRFEHHRADDVRAALEQDRTVSTVTPISTSGTRQVWGVQFASEARLLNPLVTNEGGFVLYARRSTPAKSPSGWRERWFLPGHETLYSIWQRARKAEFEFEILHFHSLDGAVSEYSAAQALTQEQRDALALAYERGDFTEPRETSLDALADELELSPSAVAGRLKRGMKLLIEESLAVNES